MKWNFFDVHSHLNLSPLSDNMEGVISRMREKGIGTITVGTDFEMSKKAIEVALKYPDIAVGATVGLHPNDNEEEIFDMEKYRELVKHPQVVAIGETGLDYFRMDAGADMEEKKEKQKKLFKQHIELAMEFDKPLMIHARPSKGTMDAYEDVLNILESYSGLRANFHFFVGDISIAQRIVKNGWTASFDGPITFARDYDEVIRFLPLESIMAETDAPFAAPVPYRGKTCESWMVEEVVKKIAEIKEMELETVKSQLLANTQKVFGV